MINEYTTPEERRYMKKAGRAYVKVLKAMCGFFFLALILSSIAVGTSHPRGGEVTLAPGESAYLANFYGEAGDTVQFAFGISQENGRNYQYTTDKTTANNQDSNWNHENDRHDVNNVFDVVQYMDTMKWLVNLQVEHSDSVKFDSFNVVVDVSGEINFVNFELYQDGHYRIKLTNMYNQELTVIAGKTEANFGLIIAALAAWTLFAMTIGLFTFMVQLGWWILVIYIIVKAVRIIQEDNQKQSYQKVIGPQVIGPEPEE